jgi:diaminohydroxyphosphoribosylaminopyrimidine deaminase/5-amino-6-(5-phosphoribosylamino)uracil reductase
VVAARDPNPNVSGGGIAELQAAGIQCEVGVLADATAELIAPFAKLVTTGRPWVIAKWAMTLDGKIATHTGDSRWISNEQSRAKVHQLRGRVDAIIVGAATAATDDPLLTARPPGPRTATRIVLAARDSIPQANQLIETSHDAPVMIATSGDPVVDFAQELSGVEIWQSVAADRTQSWFALLDELGRRQMTNVLVEGGARVFGTLFDADLIDEVHAFVAPRLVGGPAPSPIAGNGMAMMSGARTLNSPVVEQLGDDVWIHGRFS